MTTAPPNGIGFNVFPVAPAEPCAECGAEPGEPCRWSCTARPETTECVGCFHQVTQPSDHARGCPTGQNGSPRYE